MATSVWDRAKVLMPFVQAALQFVPGIGPAASAAIAAGISIASGRSLLDVGIDAAIGAMPGGPLIQGAGKSAWAAARKMMDGGSWSDAALAAVRAQVPGGLAGQAAFDAVVALATGKGAGPAGLTELSQMSPEAAQALAIVSGALSGIPVPPMPPPRAAAVPSTASIARWREEKAKKEALAASLAKYAVQKSAQTGVSSVASRMMSAELQTQLGIAKPSAVVGIGGGGSGSSPSPADASLLPSSIAILASILENNPECSSVQAGALAAQLSVPVTDMQQAIAALVHRAKRIGQGESVSALVPAPSDLVRAIGNLSLDAALANFASRAAAPARSPSPATMVMGASFAPRRLAPSLVTRLVEETPALQNVDGRTLAVMMVPTADAQGLAGLTQPGGYAFITIRNVDQIYPVKLAQQAWGDSGAGRYTELQPINPHLWSERSGWNLAVNDRINLPPAWVEPLRKYNYALTDLAAPTPPPAPPAPTPKIPDMPPSPIPVPASIDPLLLQAQGLLAVWMKRNPMDSDPADYGLVAGDLSGARSPRCSTALRTFQRTMRGRAAEHLRGAPGDTGALWVMASIVISGELDPATYKLLVESTISHSSVPSPVPSVPSPPAPTPTPATPWPTQPSTPTQPQPAPQPAPSPQPYPSAPPPAAANDKRSCCRSPPSPRSP